MPYRDETEGDPERPTACPLCRGKLVLRWRGQVMSRSPRGYTAQAWPFFVCMACKVSVRVATFPDEPLRTTRAAARRDVVAEIAERNERLNERRRQILR